MMTNTTKPAAIAVVANETDRTIHAELLCNGGCGTLGCKEKTMEDLWFAERDHKLVENLKKAS